MKEDILKWNEDNLGEDDDSDDDDDEINENNGETSKKVEVSSSEAVQAFNKAIMWSENNIFDVEDLLVLRKCRDKALQKTLAAKKVQKQITQYFNKQ